MEAKMPNLQARTMNNLPRNFMKPMMRFGGLKSIRNVARLMDSRQENNLPDDINATAVNKADYEGESVRIKGQRSRRVILYLPGGGFIICTAVMHKPFVARICRTLNAKALLVHYRLALEVPFPGSLEDCLAAYRDLLAQVYKPENITLAGDSAGGGPVLSTLLALRDEGATMPRNAIVLSRLGDLTYSGASREYNRRADPVLPTHRASHMHQLYIGDEQPSHLFISPVLADFNGLPPILGQLGSTEIRLDDTARAAAQANKADVPFYLEIWREMLHVLPIFNVLPEAQQAIDRMAQFIKDNHLDTLPQRCSENTASNPTRSRGKLCAAISPISLVRLMDLNTKKRY
jgi:acetyl esterase/lipase